MTAKVIPFTKPLDPMSATNKIREIASVSDNVKITIHTTERMDERGFSMRDLLELLRGGYVDDAPVYDNETKQYKYKITKAVDRSRTAAAITVILSDNKLLVITIMWQVF